MKRQDKTISSHVDRIEYALIALMNANDKTTVDHCVNAIKGSLAVIENKIKKEMEV